MKEGAPYRTPARAGWLIGWAAVCAIAAPLARADMLVSETTLVNGTDESVAAFTVTTAGPITVELTNIPWPQALASLSFMLSSANQVISSWSTQTSTVETYQLTPGTYYAHVSGTAAGTMDLGLYSLSIGTQPVAPVPLPPGAELLAAGLLLLMVIAWLLPGAKSRQHQPLCSA
jgi:hypothetical protein